MTFKRNIFQCSLRWLNSLKMAIFKTYLENVVPVSEATVRTFKAILPEVSNC